MACHKVQSLVTECSHLSQSAVTCHRVQSYVIECCHMSQSAVTCHRVQSLVTECCHMSQSVVTCHRVQSHVIECRFVRCDWKIDNVQFFIFLFFVLLVIFSWSLKWNSRIFVRMIDFLYTRCKKYENAMVFCFTVL